MKPVPLIVADSHGGLWLCVQNTSYADTVAFGPTGMAVDLKQHIRPHRHAFEQDEEWVALSNTQAADHVAVLVLGRAVVSGALRPA